MGNLTRFEKLKLNVEKQMQKPINYTRKNLHIVKESETEQIESEIEKI